ncbi:MAG TPA: CBS domain-containing protein [Polyangia bacterium]
MKVEQLMNRNVCTCLPSDTLATAAGRMWDLDIGSLPVVNEDGSVAGMITDRDICMAAYTQGRPLADIPVARAMSKVAYSCRPTADVAEAEEIMRTRQVRRLPVISALGELVGIVSLNDLAHEAGKPSSKSARAVSPQDVTSTLAAVTVPRRTSTAPTSRAS